MMNEILQQRIEEAAEKVVCSTQCAYFDLDKTCNCYEKKFCKRTAEEILQNQWISVEEALPKEDGWYLTLNINSTSPNFADTCQWNAKGKYWYTELCGDVFLHERTHWMEIPSLKGGEK